MSRKRVEVPVLIQDPAIASEITQSTNIIQEVILEDDRGSFTEGPACRRVAVVDFDFRTGKVGTPLKFASHRSQYKKSALYDVAVPTRQGARLDRRAGHKATFNLDEPGAIERNDAFLKVCAFGTVLRTLALIQDPAVLGREVHWAFPGKQLLVVPRAGEMDNAFYHRDSRSLQFYYGTKSNGGALFSALSQDIVAHEATHAIVDGIAPDLYDAISPESLAIHEAVADVTAALLSMRNRERPKGRDEREVLKDVQRSSRFSRIAEEFGRWRGHGDALRDVCNTKTLDARASRKQRVDGSSPHSLSEVLSGLLFRVFQGVFKQPPRGGRYSRNDAQGLRERTQYAGNRVLSLIFRGLDWLPPGDAGFADLLEAMVAADRVFLPNDDFARCLLMREAKRRCIESLGDELQIPAGARITIAHRRFHVYTPPIRGRSTSELFSLTPQLRSEYTLPANEHHLLKFAWWHTEPNDLGASWGGQRRFRTGATIVLDRDGNMLAFLRNRTAAAQSSSRSALLKRLCADDPHGPVRRIGPDGAPLDAGPRASIRGGTLSISGAMQALHISGDDLWTR